MQSSYISRVVYLFDLPSNTPSQSSFFHQIIQSIPSMEYYFKMFKSHIFVSTLFLSFLSFRASTLQTYIVQLHPKGLTRFSFVSKPDWHLSFLEHVISPESDDLSSRSRLIYSYDSAMEGFAARLLKSEVESLRMLPDVVAIRPDRVYQTQTTYSYKFLGLSPVTIDGAWHKSSFGRGAIIGVLDTGVWPESPSFNDHGMPKAPKRWKGICQHGFDFNSSNCNRKLIGARFFTRGHRVASTPSSPDGIAHEYASPRDTHGHGTHTSSTAGGASVGTASVLGNAAGVARGMAPGAHVAVYKVCWLNGCYSSDILAAMDVAILDGVDILSLSLGGFPVPLFDDSIAIGSFRAMEHGISVVCAAGNNGPIASSVANEAPWIATIGASTLDRKFPATVQMGDGKVLYGQSLYPGTRLIKGIEKELEVVYVTSDYTGSEFCFKGSLPRAKVRGKIVVCDRGVNGRAEKGEVVKAAGGAGMILANTEINLEEDSIDVHVLPATLIGYKESIHLKAYINSTRNPTARIVFQGTVIGKSRAPAVAQFSARGPSYSNPSILKPDVIAPGVNIIAGWPQNLGPTGLPDDTRRVNFTIMSGTSMACPHASGIAALVRAAHPRWSPAAVKSAIMTTADVTDHSGNPIMDGSKPAGVFAIGAGHVNPVRAVDPGLIYDIRPEEYITHLCTLGYKKSDILTITHKNVSCLEILKTYKGFSLNYPSISVIFKHGMTRKMVRRTVTNVGSPHSTYWPQVTAPKGVRVRVKPQRLVFTGTNQRLSYRVWFMSSKRIGKDKMSFAQGQLAWVSSNNGSSHKVKSPISVTWK